MAKPDTVPYPLSTTPSLKKKVRARGRKFWTKMSAVRGQELQEKAGKDNIELGSVEVEVKEEEEQPQMTKAQAIVLLVVVTVFVAITAEFLVDSIDGMASSTGVSKGFIGMILLPIVGNAAEHVTALTVSLKDKMTLSLGVAIGSSVVSPFLPSVLTQRDKPTPI
jgi:Ca2+:H+ antiporter